MTRRSTEPPEALTQFQGAYSQYLRAPQKYTLPDNVPERRSRVYESLLFNNLCGFINKCFPVAKSLIGDDQWQRLSRAFYERWQCLTPIFSLIPREFVSFIAAHDELGGTEWLPELLHYEWLELEVDLDKGMVTQPHLLIDSADTVHINPTLQVHQYQWPVHKMGPEYIPDAQAPVILCVYRTHEFDVKFMEINAVTAILLEQIHVQAQTPTAALASLAAHLPQLDPKQIDRFGRELIEQLVQSNVLLVTTHEP